MQSEVFYKQRFTSDGYFPEEGKIVTAFIGERQVLCVYQDGKFYRHTDDSGNDRLIRFYYNDVTSWLESFTIPHKVKRETFEKIIAEEIQNGNGLNAYIRCFTEAQLMSIQVIQSREQVIHDYKEVNEDKKRLVRELDMIINGKEGAAKQASLCDIVGQVAGLKRKQDEVIPDAADKLAVLLNFFDIDVIKIAATGTDSFTRDQFKTALFKAKEFVTELYDLALNIFRESPINNAWKFIAMNEVPKEEGKYYVMDKYGNQGWALYANSGAPSENLSFFEGESSFGETPIKAKNIICWMSRKDKNKHTPKTKK